jgi:sucrose phosphorylase
MHKLTHTALLLYVKRLTYSNFSFILPVTTAKKVCMKNGIILITYPDSLGHSLADLSHILDTYFPEAVRGIHILPFFPSSGDRGFAPLTYRTVEPAFGTWDDIKKLSQKYQLIFDYMINHISVQSPYFRDFLLNGDNSPWKNLFIDFRDFWNGMPTAQELEIIYKRKDCAPCTDVTLADGSVRQLWCTFSREQIDLNLKSEEGQQFLRSNLEFLASHGASMIRLDAFAYATKKAGTNCFFVEPDVWQLLDTCRETLTPFRTEILPEIHEHYSMQEKLASHGYPVYDFALPMLMLHALYFHQAKYLYHWFSICPRCQYTTLDTHDGIGVVDVRDLLPAEEIEATQNYLFRYGANVKRIYNTAQYNNLDIYQINCTFYSALGDNDKAYLLARAIQFFAPGIPQVYYVGMLAGKNDIAFLESSKEGRNINRHYYTEQEVTQEIRRPVVRELLNLMKLRNTHAAFDGIFSQRMDSDSSLTLTWTGSGCRLSLEADLTSYGYTIRDE